MDLPFYREYDLPWTTEQGQERKFRRLLGGRLSGPLVKTRFEARSTLRLYSSRRLTLPVEVFYRL